MAATPQESSALLHKKLESIIRVLAKKIPSLSILERNKNEALAVIMLVLHGHSLDKDGASFLEAFHGLQRQSILQGPKPQSTLSRGQRSVSLLFLVVLPYMNDKLQMWHKDTATLQLTPSTHLQKLRQILIKSYPFIQTISKGLTFGCETLYSLKVIKFKSPALYIQNLQIASAPIMLMTNLSYQTNNQAKNILKFMQRLLNRALNYIQLGLTLELHRSYWLKWWRGELQKKTKENYLKEMCRYSVPPPAPPTYGVPTMDIKLCPVCQEEKGMRVLCISCGYLVCEECIETRPCPLTSKPMQKRAIQLTETQFSS